ncbi:MAG TPA: helix-turn-helix domain-containing protein [Candidatus Acutalibacter stercorigallinarum]|nr:helix-turn-helix domain-containing protein [Candidatus Acutalibacter stercorigallinarum]
MGKNQDRIQYGHQIRYHRKLAGLTQAQLAQRIGVSLNSVQRYEKNERDPSTGLLFKIANALGITFFDLALGDKKKEFWEKMSPQDREDDEEYHRKLYWNRMDSIYIDLTAVSSGSFAEVFRQYFPQLNEQGQEKLAAYLQDLGKIADYQQEPVPKPKATEPWHAAPFVNPDTLLQHPPEETPTPDTEEKDGGKG